MTVQHQNDVAVKAVSHPLDDLTPQEHQLAVDTIRKTFTQFQPWFKVVQRLEPPKAILAPWLDQYHAKTSHTLASLPRKAEVVLTDPKTFDIWECVVNLSTASVEHRQKVEGNHKTNLDMTQLEKYENEVLSSPIVKKALVGLGLPEDTPIASDPWIYGCDQWEDEPAMLQFLVYMKPPRLAQDPDCFHYSYPLPFVPVVDMLKGEIVRLDWMYTGDSAQEMKHTWKEHFKPEIYQEREYMPNNIKEYGVRPDLKPLIVQQPEGPSFSVDGQRIEWQGWDMRMSWNVREGLVLHDLRFKGRSVFYRLSLSEMTVPYGDPRPPVHRKQAFDLGDAGAGVTANSLTLGCDCLGSIKYFDGMIGLPDGGMLKQKNVVCLHEQDDGIGMKHTNYRSGNPFVNRRRTLILQTIITVANYEYAFQWIFDQTGAVTYEVRATGVLSVSPIDDGQVSPYGNVVAPGVLGTNHQHIFCMRVDPRIDGDTNSLHYEDSVAMPFETAEDKARNPYGTGYTVQKTYLKQEGYADLDPSKNRTFKITNPNQINPISKLPVGYKIHLPATQMLLAHPDSVAAARAEFAHHHVWVTRYQDGQLWAAGKYTNQSRGKQGGLLTYTKRAQPTIGEDIVVWLSFGLTHNPRVEDFPVMPVESLMVSLKPNDFFDCCPILDIAPSQQVSNRSTLVHGDEGDHIPGTNGVNGTNGASNGHSNGHTNGNGASSCCKA